MNTQDKDTTLDDLLEQMELLTNGSFYDYETQEEAKRLLTQWRDKAVVEARYDERFKILNRISTMRMDISSDAIQNGRVEIMHYIAERLRQQLTKGNPQ